MLQVKHCLRGKPRQDNGLPSFIASYAPGQLALAECWTDVMKFWFDKVRFDRIRSDLVGFSEAAIALIWFDWRVAAGNRGSQLEVAGPEHAVVERDRG